MANFLSTMPECICETNHPDFNLSEDLYKKQKQPFELLPCGDDPEYSGNSQPYNFFV